VNRSILYARSVTWTSLLHNRVPNGDLSSKNLKALVEL
jgi:hypothetical protein